MSTEEEMGSKRSGQNEKDRIIRRTWEELYQFY